MSSGTATLSQTLRFESTGDRPLKESGAPCAELMRKTQLFAGLSEMQLSQIISLCRPVHYHEGQILYSEGDAPAEVCTVLQGEVEVEVRVLQDSHLRPKAVTVEKIGSGGVIGCCALVGGHMNMTARCKRDTEVAAVDARELRGALVAYPDIGLIVMGNAFRIATSRLVLAREQLVAQFGLSQMYQTYRKY